MLRQLVSRLTHLHRRPSRGVHASRDALDALATALVGVGRHPAAATLGRVALAGTAVAAVLGSAVLAGLALAVLASVLPAHPLALVVVGGVGFAAAWALPLVAVWLVCGRIDGLAR